MKIVNSFNEWDPLEEIIVGSVEHACAPEDELATQHTSPLDYGDHSWPKSGPRSKESIKKASLQLDNFVRILELQYNVKVHRPDNIDWNQPIKTPYFECEVQIGTSCPRDTLLVIGNEVIESPMSCRARYCETLAYRKILNDFWEADENLLWTMAPKSTMKDSVYRLEYPQETTSKEWRENIRNHVYITTESEPIFEAADVLRLGRDLIVQHGFSSNRKGIEWLRRHVKSRGFRVHEVHFPDDMTPVHIDASLVPFVPPTKERKGTLLQSPDRRIEQTDYDRIFPGSNWIVKDAPQPFTRITPKLSTCSCWLSINTLMIRPDVCVVEETEKPLINYLESLGIKCVLAPFRDVYEFGGSFHCATVDIRRKGVCMDYFPNLTSKETETKNSACVTNGYIA